MWDVLGPGFCVARVLNLLCGIDSGAVVAGLVDWHDGINLRESCGVKGLI